MAEKRKLICETCGTDDIQVLAWVDPNTKEYMEEASTSEAFCNYCDAHTELSFIIEDENGIEVTQ